MGRYQRQEVRKVEDRQREGEDRQAQEVEVLGQVSAVGTACEGGRERGK